jgi:hypothetical protein
LLSGGREAFVLKGLFFSGVGAAHPSDVAYVRTLDGWAFDRNALRLLSGAHKESLDSATGSLDVDALTLCETVSHSPEFSRMTDASRYLLLSEDHIETAKGSWTTLLQFGE